MIISQDPEAATLADDGTEITCTVSTGVAETTVPQLVGLTLEAATLQLGRNRLEVGQVTPQDGIADKDEVLSSTPSRVPAYPEDSEVNLVVASGKNVVPSIVDLSRADAEVAIREAGFIVGTVTEEENGDVEPGTVLRQDPAAQVVVDLGSPINFVVAIAPAVRPRRSPTSATQGLTFDEAEGALNDAGFTNVTISMILTEDSARGTRPAMRRGGPVPGGRHRG